MSAAHLRAVPNSRRRDDEGPDLRKWPAPTAVPAPEAGGLDDLDDDQLFDGEEWDGGEDDEEQPDPLPTLALPDLRPYLDVRPLGPLAVHAGKVGGPPLLRVLGRGLRVLGRGLAVLLRLLGGWLSGTVGKASRGVRFASTAFGSYGIVRLCLSHATWRLPMGGALLLLAVAAGTGRITAPKGKAKTKTGRLKGLIKGPNRTADSPQVEAEKALVKGAEITLEKASVKALDKAPKMVLPEGPEEALDEVLPEDAIEALYALVQGGRGVLLTTLREDLDLADTRALKSLLNEAGIRVRPGVRSVAGNGPGVHRDDFPPLPPAEDPPMGGVLSQVGAANANANNTANGPREGLDVQGIQPWTREEITQGYRFVQDLERGTSAWKIERR